jgi:hypothetical protein
MHLVVCGEDQRNPTALGKRTQPIQFLRTLALGLLVIRLALAKCENRLPLGDWDASGQLPHTRGFCPCVIPIWPLG